MERTVISCLSALVRYLVLRQTRTMFWVKFTAGKEDIMLSKTKFVLFAAAAIIIVSASIGTSSTVNAACSDRPGYTKEKCRALASMGLDVFGPEAPGGGSYNTFDVIPKKDQKMCSDGSPAKLIASKPGPKGGVYRIWEHC